ncbi:MAG: DUF3090 family protein [Chloroflexi bacterium]|nr:DUF3090 family protein [Chloroflexota bacterium]
MARRVHIFDPPDRFVCGTVGPVGERTFFLQAIAGPRIISVALEKVQVAVMADRIGAILAELDRRGTAPALQATVEQDERPLDEPLREEFRVGTIALSWDEDQGVLEVEARAQTDDPEVLEVERDDDDEGPDLVRVRISPLAARGFVERAARIVAGGRPPCPFCGQPLEPQGHLCPRRNGYLN